MTRATQFDIALRNKQRKILTKSSSAISSARIRTIRAHLKHSGLVAYATESCFGLGCDPTNYRALKKLFSVKKRPWQKGLILIASNFAQIQPFVKPLEQLPIERLVDTWPGPHTWLIPVSRHCPRWLRGRHNTLAVRITAHPHSARLCHALNSALVSTSANRSGLKPKKTYIDCQHAFGRSALVVPGLIGKSKKPSTIQDLQTGKILRR